MAIAGLGRKQLGVSAIALAVVTCVAPGPAQAGWEDDFGTLRIGMVSNSGGRGVAGLGQLTTAYERATGVSVQIMVARDYPALIRAQAQGRIHYAVYSAAAYGVAAALCGCVEPLAAPRGLGGATGVQAVAIGRRGGSDGLADIEGARVVSGPGEEVGPQSLAMAVIAADGTSARPASITHAASQSEAERAFIEGEADILLGWRPTGDEKDADPSVGTLARLEAGGMALDGLEVLWASDTIAYGPHAVRTDLPDELKRRLGRFLLHVHEQQPDIYQLLEPYRGGGFAPIAADAYGGARAIVDRYASR
ncbi:MAG: PhnD/SsuA/transferrin family substrate-binding protein [Rhizobiaceae bacterium]|nr:PhnD/SsuA/transferrin family substrate-binding protein [Rhizobiaceae bacterium]